MDEENFIGESAVSKILELIDDIRGLFRRHFQSGYFYTVLERMRFNPVYLNDIERLIKQQSIYPGDYYLLKTGVTALQEFVGFARRYIQPVIREELGISGFGVQSNRSRDRTAKVVKELFAATFPHNLHTLTELTAQLHFQVERMAEEERKNPAAKQHVSGGFDFFTYSFSGSRPSFR
jgi:hypothetical protein